jgi:hypothetical protein
VWLLATNGRTAVSEVSKPKPMLSSGTQYFLLIAGILVFLSWLGGGFKSKPEIPKTPAQILEEKQQNLGRLLYVTVRQALRDPSHMDVVELMVDKNAKIACMKYRARNGFGGMSVETAVARRDVVETGNRSWKKYCSGPMLDMLWDVRNAEVIYRMYSR